VKPAILVCGQTGTGKSSIVNFYLRQPVAKVGNNAESVRNGFPPINYENNDVTFYDCDGYEIGSTDVYKNKLLGFLWEKNRKPGVHLVWYTINAAAHRVTEFDRELVDLLARDFRVFILLTKIDECDEDGLAEFYDEVCNFIPETLIYKVSIVKEIQNYTDWDALVKLTKNALGIGQTYKIGDRGPADGIVFYDKGSFSDGWRYMEAAPADLREARWDLFMRNISGIGTGIGSGKRNTELIIGGPLGVIIGGVIGPIGAIIGEVIGHQLGRKVESRVAAPLCMAYRLNGYNDWFLPSKDELNEMFKNLKRKKLGGLTDSWYWSSSLFDNSNLPWIQNFSNGMQGNTNPDNTCLVRAVRAF